MVVEACCFRPALPGQRGVVSAAHVPVASCGTRSLNGSVLVCNHWHEGCGRVVIGGLTV